VTSGELLALYVAISFRDDTKKPLVASFVSFRRVSATLDWALLQPSDLA